MKITFIIIAFHIISISVFAQTGKTVSTLSLVNVMNDSTEIPDLGQKVVTVFYLDPDVQELNDPLSDALETVKFPLDRLAVVGIANCKDTWLPNAAIRLKAKRKQTRFPESLILLDYKHTLASEWNLGDCNNKLIVLVIGKDSKIKYLHTVTSLSESKAIVPDFLETIKKEIVR